MSVGVVNKQTGERIPTAGMPAIDSVLSGSSTNPVQNRVVKAALDEKADTDIVASDFDATASYTAGNYCIYEGKFYKFKNNHTGAWSAADVDEIQIAGELASLKSGLTNLHYHKVTESASTGTYAQKLQSLATAYNTLSFAQRRSALLVMNTVDIFQPVNCSGNWFSVWIDSTGANASRYGIDGSAYVESGGTVTDNSIIENANVFELWVCEP